VSIGNSSILSSTNTCVYLWHLDDNKRPYGEVEKFVLGPQDRMAWACVNPLSEIENNEVTMQKSSLPYILGKGETDEKERQFRPVLQRNYLFNKKGYIFSSLESNKATLANSEFGKKPNC
jgi:hypothetical protein